MACIGRVLHSVAVFGRVAILYSEGVQESFSTTRLRADSCSGESKGHPLRSACVIMSGCYKLRHYHCS